MVDRWYYIRYKTGRIYCGMKDQRQKGCSCRIKWSTVVEAGGMVEAIELALINGKERGEIK